MKYRVSQVIIYVLLLILSITSCKKAAHPLKTEKYNNLQTGFETLVKGVNSLGSPDAIPGPIVPDSNWINIAFCPSFYKDSIKKMPGIFAAARTYKDGRVFAMGHEGHFGPDLDKEDNRQFAINVVKWLDVANKKRICVRQTQWSPGIEQGLLKELKIAEYTLHFVKREDELIDYDLKDRDFI